MNQIYTYKDKRLIVKRLKKFKSFCLTTILTTTCIAISISWFIPNPKARPKFQFPSQIDVSGWKFQSSNDFTNLKGNAIAAKQYFYTSPTQDTLQIDVLYINGIVSIPQSLGIIDLKYLRNSLDIRYSQNVGYYALFTDQKRAYLSSCINPRGTATVTEDQFISNRNRYDITPDRVVSYLIGVTDLRDSRCLFTTMSIALTPKMVNQSNYALDKTYQKLEIVWFHWYQNWSDNFPKS
jgi:cyanosortase A-associated protein